MRPYSASISRILSYTDALSFFQLLNLYYLYTTHLSFLIAFPSLVNELFIRLYPLSKSSQANDPDQYSRRLIIVNH